MRCRFRRGLAMLLDRVPSQTDSDELFDEWDRDRNGQLEYKELWRHLRGLGPRKPRAPLWAAKAPRRPPSSSPDVQGGVIPETVATSAEPHRDQKQLSPTPDATKLISLDYARSEAVLLGELLGRPRSETALSRKRVVTLNQLKDSAVRAASKEMQRLEIVERTQLHAEARKRQQRSEAAKQRHAHLAHSTVSRRHAGGKSIGDSDRSSGVGTFTSLAELENVGAAQRFPAAGTAAFTGEMSTGSDLPAAQITATALLPWAACNWVSNNAAISSPPAPSQLGLQSSLTGRNASASSLQASASYSHFTTDAFPFGCREISDSLARRRTPGAASSWSAASDKSYARGGIRGYSRLEADDAIFAGAVPSPQRAQAVWPRDETDSIRPPNLAAGPMRPPTLVRSHSSTPSAFTSSLRKPSGILALQIPTLPRPATSEADRVGLFNDKSDAALGTKGPVPHKKFSRRRETADEKATPELIAAERARRIAEWLGNRLSDD